MKTIILSFVILLLISISCKKDKHTVPYPTTGLISYFNFDDNLKDIQGGSTDGVVINGPVFTAGKIAKGISLDGVNQKVNIYPKAAISYPGISFSFWVKSGTDNFPLFLVVSDCAFGFTQNLISFTVATQLQSVKSATATFSPNIWTHITGTYDGTEIKIYTNGVLQATISNPGTIKGFSSALFIGENNGSYWAGNIDELYLYNRALSQAEVTQLYNLK